MFGQILALVLTALLGGLAPIFVRRSDRVLHLFVSFATGVFLGILFLHLLPEEFTYRAEISCPVFPGGNQGVSGLKSFFPVQLIQHRGQGWRAEIDT